MGVRFFPQEEERELESKSYWFLAILITGLALLLLRAWHLQITKGAYYLELSENNRLRVVETPAPRGRIFDRNGALLVNNVPSFNLYVVLGDIKQREQVIRRISQIINIPIDEITEQIQKKKKGDPYHPIKIKEDLTMREVAVIEGHGLQLPGIKIEAEYKRQAVFGSLAAHLLGYVGEITQDQLKQEKYQTINGGSIIGKYGVEQSFDAILRGTSGEKKIEVDALGHEQQVVKEILPLRGDDIYLTMDLKVQKTAENVLADRPGAIVALNPKNGDVLAMVSHPSFNPNDISGGISTKTWQTLLKDKNLPLTNRTIHGKYPPGSTFKIVLSAAILETGIAKAKDRIKCKGTFELGDREFRDWKKWGHGEVDMHRSLVESCDVYYYEKGLELGVDTIARFSHLFGLGKPTGIDLAYEKGGLIPTKDWKEKNLKKPWYPGETLSVSIGQGFVSSTPLQLATMIAAIAGDGIWYRPRLLVKTRDTATEQFSEIESAQGRKIPISAASLATIKKALAGVVSEKLGTAQASKSDLFSMAGKTGTAQVVGRETIAFDLVPEEFADHAWFVAFAPVENPKIAVVVLVENGGHGGSAAAPLARTVIESYLEPRQVETQPIENAIGHSPEPSHQDQDHG